MAGAHGDGGDAHRCSRVVDHVPSHYAMLGVPKNFQSGSRKQYRLLARARTTRRGAA